MAESVDSVVLQLEARFGQYNSDVANAASATEKNLQRVQESATQTEKVVGHAFENTRVSQQILMHVARSTADSFAAGTPPMQIFATHLAQLAEAGAYAGGAFGKVGAFLAGPWGIAVTAATAVLLPLIGRLFETDSALKHVKSTAEQAADAMKAMWAELDNASKSSDAATKNVSTLVTSMAQVAQLTQQLNALRQTRASLTTTPGGAEMARGYDARIADLSAQLATARKNQSDAQEGLAGISAAARVRQMQERNEAALHDKPAGAGRERHPRAPGMGRAGPDPQAIDKQFNDQLEGYTQRGLSAMEQVATSAEEEANLRLKSVEHQRIRNLADIEDNKNYSDVQKVRLTQEAERSAEAEREAIEFQKQARIEQEATQLAESRHQASEDALREQYDLAKTDAQRRDLALQILDADDAYLRSKLEGVAASKTATDAEKAQARVTLDALNNTAAPRRALVELQHENPLERYSDSLTDPKTRVQEAVVKELQAVNQGITDALASELGIKDQFVKSLFSIFLDNVIFKPLADALSGHGGGGIGNFFSSIVGSIFGGGRASGGPISSGTPYLVGERGPEIIVPHSSGVVIPNQQLINSGGGQGGVATVRLELSGDIDARIEQVSGPVAIEVVRAAAPSIVAASSTETVRAVSRRRLP